MALRFGLVTAVLGFSFASMWSVPHAAADPTWDLVETTCMSGNGGCPGGYSAGSFTLPLTLGSIEGTGTFINYVTCDGDTGTCTSNVTSSGDYDWNLPVLLPSSGVPYCDASGPTYCHVDVQLTDSPSGEFGEVSFEDNYDDINYDLSFDGRTFGGNWGSDGPIEGCGEFVDCYITGDLVSTPEPSSLPMLLAGLGLVGGAFYFGRKKVLAS